jgi:hypothetical protein
VLSVVIFCAHPLAIHPHGTAQTTDTVNAAVRPVLMTRATHSFGCAVGPS